jgi:hypothetical protein
MKRMKMAGSIAGFFVISALLVTVQFSACASASSAVSPEASGHVPVAGETAHGGETSSALHGEVQEITTSYGQLWSSDTITVKVGVPVRWYVEAAPGSLPMKGMACGKTIKIPGLGWGTDSYNDGEGHLTLVEGKNLVYEFTPSEVGDILFTCWMGSECHSNYIHVTADGTYTGAPRSGGGHHHTMPAKEMGPHPDGNS